MKIKNLLIILILSSSIYADKVEITSTSMKAKNLKKRVTFIENVKIKQVNSWLNADKVVVFFNENNETKQYDATGNVSFEFIDKRKKQTTKEKPIKLNIFQ